MPSITRVVSSQAYLFTTEPGTKTWQHAGVWVVFYGPWHFKTRLYLVNFLGFNHPIKMPVPEFTRKKDYIMWHLQLNASCFLQDFSKKRRISVCDFGRLWDLGPFCQSPAVWNPSKLTCLFEVSKYGVGWCWVHQKLCLRGWYWGWFDPRHSGNSQNQPTSKIQLQQWIVFTSQVFLP